MRPSVVNGTTSTPPGGVRFGQFAGEGSVRSSPTQRQSCRPSFELPTYANFMQIRWSFVLFTRVAVKVSGSVLDEVTRFHSSNVSFVHWPRRLTRRVHLRRATIQRKFDPKFRRGFSVLLSGRRNGAQSRHFGRSLAAFIDSDNLTDDSHSTCDFFPLSQFCSPSPRKYLDGKCFIHLIKSSPKVRLRRLCRYQFRWNAHKSICRWQTRPVQFKLAVIAVRLRNSFELFWPFIYCDFHWHVDLKFKMKQIICINFNAFRDSGRQGRCQVIGNKIKCFTCDLHLISILQSAQSPTKWL